MLRLYSKEVSGLRPGGRYKHEGLVKELRRRPGALPSLVSFYFASHASIAGCRLADVVENVSMGLAPGVCICVENTPYEIVLNR
jgi:hypothetical protein